MIEANLHHRWIALQQGEPRLRIRDAANRMGVKEAEVLAAGCPDPNTRLRPEFPALLDGLRGLGDLTIIVRNDAAVHEKTGPFTETEISSHVGLVHGGPIDLRLFMRPWSHVFAVRVPVKESVRRSIQFFDERGDAILKAFLPLDAAAEKVEAFEALSRSFSVGAPADLVLKPGSAPVDRPDADIDVAALRADWEALQDTHDFFGMLRKHEVGRLQALRLIGSPFSVQVATDIALPLLQHAADTSLPIMVFAGNRGAINIHTGAVNNIKVLGKWVNVIDPEFSLHLDQSQVATAWQVVKPTVDGDVTSVELYDEAGESIALFFGERKPGRAELPGWRQALDIVKGRVHG